MDAAKILIDAYLAGKWTHRLSIAEVFTPTSNVSAFDLRVTALALRRYSERNDPEFIFALLECERTLRKEEADAERQKAKASEELIAASRTLDMCREKGRQDFLDSRPIKPNPFNGSTLRGKAWLEGYRDAYRAKTEKP